MLSRSLSSQQMKHGLSVNGRITQVGQRFRRHFESLDVESLFDPSARQPGPQPKTKAHAVPAATTFLSARCKQFVQSANHATDLLIGGYQLGLGHQLVWRIAIQRQLQRKRSERQRHSPILRQAVGAFQTRRGTCTPASQKFVTNSSGTGSRTFLSGADDQCDHRSGDGYLHEPWSGQIGNAGLNTYQQSDFLLNRSCHQQGGLRSGESVVTKFRMDAFSTPLTTSPRATPGGNIESTGTINGEGGVLGGLRQLTADRASFRTLPPRPVLSEREV